MKDLTLTIGPFESEELRNEFVSWWSNEGEQMFGDCLDIRGIPHEYLYYFKSIKDGYLELTGKVDE